jgi:biotin carboxylase
MTGKTILIIGAGRLQIPAIKKAKEMGLFVVATDYNENAPGLALADDRIIMSTRDVDGSARVAKRYQQEVRRIHGVLTVGTDASMTVAAVANALHLPGIRFSNAEAASNKLKMRARLHAFGVPCPDYGECWTLEDALKHFERMGSAPVVLKPGNNMGARGVSQAITADGVKRAFSFAKEASPSGEVIIEEYMSGPELSIDALIYKGTIHICGVADRLITAPPFFVETGHIMPTALASEFIEDAVSVFCRGIRALGIDSGAAKGDIKITPKGAMVGEIAARLSGGFMSAYTYPYSSGVDLNANAIRIAMGNAPRGLKEKLHRVSMEAAIIPRPGTVKSIEGLDTALAIPGVRHIFMNIDIGDTVTRPRSNVEKAGHIIAVADTREEVLAIIKKAQAAITIGVEKIKTKKGNA